jgi:hypothetical protein
MDIIEDHVKEMIDSSAAGLQGREYQVLSRAISFRHSTKGSWRTVALEDFSYASGVRLFNEVDSALARYKKVDFVDFRVEVKVSADATKPAFNRQQTGADSSDIEITPMSSKRTDRLLFEQRARSKAEAKRLEEINRREDIVQSSNHREQVVKANRCNEEGCLNTGNTCWASRETGNHYATCWKCFLANLSHLLS